MHFSGKNDLIIKVIIGFSDYVLTSTCKLSCPILSVDYQD